MGACIFKTVRLNVLHFSRSSLRLLINVQCHNFGKLPSVIADIFVLHLAIFNHWWIWVQDRAKNSGTERKEEGSDVSFFLFCETRLVPQGCRETKCILFKSHWLTGRTTSFNFISFLPQIKIFFNDWIILTDRSLVVDSTIIHWQNSKPQQYCVWTHENYH